MAHLGTSLIHQVIRGLKPFIHSLCLGLDLELASILPI